jgi:hypothetical protein
MTKELEEPTEPHDTPFRYCSAVIQPLSENSLLVKNLITGNLSITPPQVVAVASRCLQYATMEEHCTKISTASKIDFQMCASLLREAEEARLFLVRTDESLAFQKLEHRPTYIDIIGIPTRNRPSLLRRMLASLRPHLMKHEQKVTILVIDDSPDAAMRALNQQVVDMYTSIPKMTVAYISPETRSRYSNEVCRRSGCDPSLVQFALNADLRATVTVGAARNFMLLGSLGHNILFIDDDVVLDLCRTPSSNDGIDIGESSIQRFYDHNTLSQTIDCPENVLDLHDRMLNVNIREVWKHSIGARLSSEMLRRIRSQKTQVIASQMGMKGDCGIDHPFTLFIQDDEAWGRLTNTQESYTNGMYKRQVLSGGTAFNVTPHIHTQAYCLGINNSRGTPPTLPVMRGEDAILGLLLRLGNPDAFFGILPRAVRHCPESMRRFDHGVAVRHAGRFSMAETINLLITMSGPIWGRTWQERIGAIGASMATLERADDIEMREHLRRLIEPLLIKWLCRIERRIATSSPGAEWLYDMIGIRDNLLLALNSVDHLIPWDLPSHSRNEHEYSAFRSIINKYALLLQAWPAFLQAASSSEYSITHSFPGV